MRRAPERWRRRRDGSHSNSHVDIIVAMQARRGQTVVDATLRDLGGALVLSRGQMVGGLPVAGFDAGMLASALVCSDRVLLHLPAAYPIALLLKDLGGVVLLELVASGALAFSLRPDSAMTGVVERSGTGEIGLGTIRLVEEEGAYPHGSPEWLHQMLVTHDVDRELSGADIDCLAAAIRVAPIPNVDLTEMMRDWTEPTYEFVGRHFSDVHGDACRLELFDGLRAAAHDGIWVVDPTDEDARMFVSEVLSDLEEARVQQCLVETSHCRVVFGEEKTCRLVAGIAASTRARSVRREGVLDMMTDALEQPSVSWLVNRDALSLSDVVSFVRSEDGRRLRQALVLSDGDAGRLALVTEAMTLDSPMPWWGSAPQKFLSLIWKTFAGPGAFGIQVAEVGMDQIKKLSAPRTPLQVLAKDLVPMVDQRRSQVEARRTQMPPRVSEIEREGGYPLLCFDVGTGSAICFFQDVNTARAWEVCVLLDKTGRDYVDTFQTRLPRHGTPERLLVDRLGEGWEMDAFRLEIRRYSAAPEEVHLTYELRRADETETVTTSNQRFAHIVVGYSMLSHPDEYAEWRNKAMATLKRAAEKPEKDQ